ncbi:hypothetical protein [Xanthobacter autotrophicus]|uniref:hypothetical protein n=1 Tax=Xanthobacter autotrophicus TaxID=280 RepID=UPI0037294126
MATQFDLFRISVVAKQRPSLFAKTEDKDAYIVRVFSEKWHFEHRKTKFYYVYISSSQGHIISKIGRERVIDYNTAPETGFEREQMPAWQASTLVIDPKDHQDGHKLAFEIIQQLGNALSIMKSMFKHINNAVDSSFDLEINPIVNPGTFFSFVEKSESPVSYLSITFTPPNGLWTAGSSAKEEVKQIVDNTGATKVKTTVSNPNGLDTTSKGLKEAVDYAESGSGSIRARTVNGTRYSSDVNQKSAIILGDSDDVQQNVIENPQQALGQN